ncbi:MAG: hypothetical protein NC116_12320 [Clostridium sp.]|nr:hypothetical protein [Clostridium sp.]
MMLAIFFCASIYAQTKETSDTEFNNSKTACYVNGIFVKSPIGVNTNKKAEGVKDAYIKKGLPPFTVNGVTYINRLDVTYEGTPELISLADVRELYCPNIKGTVVYMIDNYFITKDVNSYKLDKNFIDRCEELKSSDIEALNGQNDFTVIRVFTQRHKKDIRLK